MPSTPSSFQISTSITERTGQKCFFFSFIDRIFTVIMHLEILFYMHIEIQQGFSSYPYKVLIFFQADAICCFGASLKLKESFCVLQTCADAINVRWKKCIDFLRTVFLCQLFSVALRARTDRSESINYIRRMFRF